MKIKTIVATAYSLLASRAVPGIPHEPIAAPNTAKKAAPKTSDMLGGKVYVGFAFAQQLHRLAVFVFAK